MSKNWWNNRGINCEYLTAVYIWRVDGGWRWNNTGCNCVIYDWFWDTARSNAVVLSIRSIMLSNDFIFSSIQGTCEGVMKGWRIASHNKRTAQRRRKFHYNFPSEIERNFSLFELSCWLPVRINFIMQKLCNDFDSFPLCAILWVSFRWLLLNVLMLFASISPLSTGENFHFFHKLCRFVKWKSLMGLNFMR